MEEGVSQTREEVVGFLSDRIDSKGSLFISSNFLVLLSFVVEDVMLQLLLLPVHR
jgi:hypothetical protein